MKPRLFPRTSQKHFCLLMSSVCIIAVLFMGGELNIFNILHSSSFHSEADRNPNEDRTRELVEEVKQYQDLTEVPNDVRPSFGRDGCE